MEFNQLRENADRLFGMADEVADVIAERQDSGGSPLDNDVLIRAGIAAADFTRCAEQAMRDGARESARREFGQRPYNCHH